MIKTSNTNQELSVMIRSIVHHIKLLILLLLDLFFRLKKFIEFIISGKHEFQRICEAPCDIYEKTMRINQWLKRTNCEQIRDFLKRNSLLHKEIEKYLSLYRAASKLDIKRTKIEAYTNVHRRHNIDTGDGDIKFSSVLRTLTKDFVRTIKKSKRTKLTIECEEILYDILYRIICYDVSLLLAEKLAAIKYDPDMNSHSNKLIDLWNNLIRADREIDKNSSAFPSELRSEIADKSDIISNRWSHIGFQGEDPGTDFRGMGLLGLMQLEYLSKRPKNLARDLLERSLNEEHSYPFAIVGINITYNLLNLFKDGSMKHLYYDTGDALFRGKRRTLNLITTFNDLYVELFLRFDCFWHESKPENIFAFRELMEKFISVVKMDLCNRNFAFKFIY